ncbi:hypothetical protein [Actinopolymorpha sp. B9G3]|uniref:hypothetical protein n=1 Tax=Actinopolymorpha sp. B9G3 TaxID=3158970 RepID=UPI0032D963CB
MTMNVPTFTVRVPQYQVDTEPDHNAVGKVVDAELQKHFMGRTVVVRGVCSPSHPGKTVDDLVQIVKRHGVDRYDPHRKGHGYENIDGKHIDLFAFRRKVTPRMRLFKDLSWGFYHGAIASHRTPYRIDILLVYDAAQLKAVLHQYEGRTDKKRDGFVFRDPERKQKALLGIVTIS